MESNHGFLLSKKANYQCMGSFMSGNLFFQGMMYLITLVFGGWLIAHGQMEVADLAMYALYIGIFISPIQILVELTEMMQKGLSGFRRFLDVVETEPEITNAPDAELLDDVKGDVNYEMFSFIIVMMTRRFWKCIVPYSGWKINCVGWSFWKWQDNNLFPASKILRCNRWKDYG